MKIRHKPALLFVALATAVVLLTFAVHHFRDRLIRTDRDLVAMLPSSPGATIGFINIRTLRIAHVANLLSIVEPTSEPDYRAFVDSTGLNYTRDMDAIAFSSMGDGVAFVGRGRFDWSRMSAYVAEHGGTCSSSVCSAKTSTGRWATVQRMQPDVLAVLVGPQQEKLSGKGMTVAVSDAPLWVSFPPSLLAGADLPFPLGIVSAGFSGAERLTASIEVDGPLHLDLRVEAAFPDAGSADRCRRQLEIETRMLKIQLARQHRAPDAGDLTGLFADGTFEAAGRDTVATWPLHQELLKSFQ